ncbi:MAG: RNA 2',3'-cyclic phosphodiesterase [Chloroflexota bacterium]|nr:RNA 2',3'-cyclic phosphodiesterase [Chloroflexota bacterium]
MIRAFIAVNPPAEILNKIKKISAYFQTQTPEDALKWSGIKKYHLTLKFLGEISENKLPEIKTILARTAKTQTAFEISVGGLKFFPNVKKPHTIVLGVQEGMPLVRLHQRLDFELQAVGFPGDKRTFTPHLTLARVRRSVNRARAAKIGETLSQFRVDTLGQFVVDEVHLYQSELNPKGSIYTPLFTSRLREV